MSDQLKNTEAGRLLYNQLRLNLLMPGEEIADQRRRYTPVNHEPTFDDIIARYDDAPPLPYPYTFWALLGTHAGQAAKGAAA